MRCVEKRWAEKNSKQTNERNAAGREGSFFNLLCRRCFSCDSEKAQEKILFTKVQL